MNNPQKPTRRDLLVSGTAAAALGATPVLGRRGESKEVLRVGLVGCGGRGTGAAAQALRADPNTKLVALADAFPDALRVGLQAFQCMDTMHSVMTVMDIGLANECMSMLLPLHQARIALSRAS